MKRFPPSYDHKSFIIHVCCFSSIIRLSDTAIVTISYQDHVKPQSRIFCPFANGCPTCVLGINSLNTSDYMSRIRQANSLVRGQGRPIADMARCWTHWENVDPSHHHARFDSCSRCRCPIQKFHIRLICLIVIVLPSSVL